MDAFCNTFSTEVICAYFAVVLVLTVLVFMHVWKIGYHFNERFEERQSDVYTSGAGQRVEVARTSFTGGNQGAYTSGSNAHERADDVFERIAARQAAQAARAEQAAATDVELTGDAASEALTATIGHGPDTWAVGHDMYAYKTGITGQTPLATGRNGMNMQNMTTEHMTDDPYEHLLFQSLSAGA